MYIHLPLDKLQFDRIVKFKKTLPHPLVRKYHMFETKKGAAIPYPHFSAFSAIFEWFSPVQL
jgi:hypothetical protein